MDWNALSVVTGVRCDFLRAQCFRVLNGFQCGRLETLRQTSRLGWEGQEDSERPQGLSLSPSSRSQKERGFGVGMKYGNPFHFYLNEDHSHSETGPRTTSYCSHYRLVRPFPRGSK